MTIYEFVNSELLRKDVSVYVGVEDADKLISDIIENDEYLENYFEEVLEENEVVIVSRVYTGEGIEWFVDPITYDGRTQVYNETDVALIEEDLLEYVDFSKIDCEEMVVLEQRDEYDELIQELAHGLLEDLEDLDEDECPCCLVKDYFKALLQVVEE